nr:immunoglobulin heavy chain junction region [Macaca mulatta]MOW32976.1 immunoglobulin heavy chain junction region [Macaca mulatta]
CARDPPPYFYDNGYYTPEYFEFW